MARGGAGQRGRPQPLFAAYRTRRAALAALLVRWRAPRLRARRAGGRAHVEPFELLVVDDVAAYDPGLASFLSFDSAEAFAAALALPQPLVRVTGGLAGPAEIRASTVDRARRALAGRRGARGRALGARRR